MKKRERIDTSVSSKSRAEEQDLSCEEERKKKLSGYRFIFLGKSTMYKTPDQTYVKIDQRNATSFLASQQCIRHRIKRM